MAKRTKFIIIAAIIALTVILGYAGANAQGIQTDEVFRLATSLNISLNSDNFAPKDIRVKGVNSSAMYDDRITDTAQLKNISDFIYEITILSRIQYDDMVETKAKVTKVLKDMDNHHKVDDFIYLFERCSSNGIARISADSTLFPMRYGQKYLVFLNEIESYINHTRFNLSTLNYSIIPVKQDMKVVEITDEIHDAVNLNEKTWGFDYAYMTKFDLVHFLLNTMDLKKVKEQSDIDLANYLVQAGTNVDIEYATSIRERVTNAIYSQNYFANYTNIVKETLKEYYGFDVHFDEVSYGE
jgi:hypothetical protein